MKAELFDAMVAFRLPAPLLALVSTVIVPAGLGFLPTVKNKVARNESDGEPGVGLGDGEGLGDGVGVGLGEGVGFGAPGDGEGVAAGVGFGCILLLPDPHPARNTKRPESNTKVAVRKRDLLICYSQFRGELN